MEKCDSAWEVLGATATSVLSQGKYEHDLDANTDKLQNLLQAFGADRLRSFGFGVFFSKKKSTFFVLLFL